MNFWVAWKKHGVIFLLVFIGFDLTEMKEVSHCIFSGAGIMIIVKCCEVCF